MKMDKLADQSWNKTLVKNWLIEHMLNWTLFVHIAMKVLKCQQFSINLKMGRKLDLIFAQMLNAIKKSLHKLSETE